MTKLVCIKEYIVSNPWFNFEFEVGKTYELCEVQKAWTDTWRFETPNRSGICAPISHFTTLIRHRDNQLNKLGITCNTDSKSEIE